ncbi:hypothetical protein IJ670_04780 [bacterium]|nr:hypothetical protein [bacterium]
MTEGFIAFWGSPDIQIVNKIKEKYPNSPWLDLDIESDCPDLKFIPDNYCTIIKNIYNNALSNKDKIIKIVAPIGKDKCDSAYFIAKILQEKGFDVEMCENEKKCPNPKDIKIPISKSNLPLKDKIILITKNIYEQKDYSNLEQIKPRFGFWGVPPNKLKVLDIFPNDTAIYGWCRAVEAGYPADWNIETYVDKDVPTVFFTQAFCSKSTVAKYLATKFHGLLIDIDTIPTKSTMAKLEAFLKLR